MGRQQGIKSSRKELRKVVGDNIVTDFMNLVNNQNILHRDHLALLAIVNGGFLARLKWFIFGVALPSEDKANG